MHDLVKRGLSAKRESKYIDFKSSLDFNESNSWCEIIKDIIGPLHNQSTRVEDCIEHHSLPKRELDEFKKKLGL